VLLLLLLLLLHYCNFCFHITLQALAVNCAAAHELIDGLHEDLMVADDVTVTALAADSTGLESLTRTS
jgi:hypothetical protein